MCLLSDGSPVEQLHCQAYHFNTAISRGTLGEGGGGGRAAKNARQER